jgi:hypothetical protein
MKPKVRALLIIALIGLVSGLTWFLQHRRNHPLLQGKTEAAWIESLGRPFVEDEPDQWRALGPRGIQLLCQALNQGNGRLAVCYSQFYNSAIGNSLKKCLPTPLYARPIHEHAAYLLFQLRLDAKASVSELIRALKNETNDNVRMTLLADFLSNPGLLDGNPREKAALLPELIKDTQHSSLAVRKDAIGVLRLYTEQSQVVVPVLVKCLQDPVPDVRWNAVMALQKIAPNAAKPEIVQTIVKMVQINEEPQFLPGRIEWLGGLGTNALPAVSILLETIKSTNTPLADAATHALQKINPQAAAQAGPSNP